MAFSLTSSWIEMADGVFPFFRVSVSRHICTGSELGDIFPGRRIYGKFVHQFCFVVALNNEWT